MSAVGFESHIFSQKWSLSFQIKRKHPCCPLISMKWNSSFSGIHTVYARCIHSGKQINTSRTHAINLYSHPCVCVCVWGLRGLLAAAECQVSPKGDIFCRVSHQCTFLGLRPAFLKTRPKIICVWMLLHQGAFTKQQQKCWATDCVEKAFCRS